MKTLNPFYDKKTISLQLIAILHWLIFLMDSDSYYSVYLVCAIFGTISLFHNRRRNSPLKKREGIFLCAVSMAYSIAVLLANWSMFHDLFLAGTDGFSLLYHFCFYSIMLLAGFSICFNILLFMYDQCSAFQWKAQERDKKQVLLFAAVSMSALCAINLLYLFLCGYPGNLTWDSVNQLEQIFSGTYSNHHPFWHTMIIKLWVNVGLWLFHDINAAVAVYSVFQIIVMALIFTYVLTAFFQIGVPLSAVGGCLAWYAVMPFHIFYSITMWKDILFGGMAVLWVAALYRMFNNIGSQKLNGICLVLGSLGVCLFRSNGLAAFVVSAILFAVLYKKKHLRITVAFAMIILLAFIMKHPVLKALNVSQPDFVEFLSVPLQQIGKTVTDGKELTDGQRNLLDKIIDVDEIPFLYSCWTSDPMKNAIRDYGQQDYLAGHKTEYFRLWLELGLKYPKEYLWAWIEETKGYWNGGYDLWIWDNGVIENSMGIVKTVHSETALKFVQGYEQLFGLNKALKPFLSIGFHFWIVVILVCCNILLKRKTETFMAIPVLAVILSLLLTTPVYSEFRYAYSLFTSIPLIALSTAYHYEGGPPQAEKNYHEIVQRWRNSPGKGQRSIN